MNMPIYKTAETLINQPGDLSHWTNQPCQFQISILTIRQTVLDTDNTKAYWYSTMPNIVSGAVIY
jgi:hypothetical protein